MSNDSLVVGTKWQSVVAFQQMSAEEQFRDWLKVQGKEYLPAPAVERLPHLEPIAKAAKSWVECCNWLPEADRFEQLRYMVYSPSFGGDLLCCQFTDLGWWHEGLAVNISGVTHWRLAGADETDHLAAPDDLLLLGVMSSEEVLLPKEYALPVVFSDDGNRCPLFAQLDSTQNFGAIAAMAPLLIADTADHQVVDLLADTRADISSALSYQTLTFTARTEGHCAGEDEYPAITHDFRLWPIEGQRIGGAIGFRGWGGNADTSESA